MPAMNESFDLQAYLTKGVEQVVKDAVRDTLKNPRESAFMARFAAASAKASQRRAALEKKGEHVPSYLISSITSACNLHCAGCYSRCAEATVDTEPVKQLTDAEWDRIFTEADDLGISFVFLAGGEPLLRRDVIRKAAEHPGILFPILTNGTFLDAVYLDLFDKSRNLVPIMSIEGGREATDSRRGEGIYDRLVKNMGALADRGILFGASVTVTKENLHEVTGPDFLGLLLEKGCKAVLFVEYVPVDEETTGLALTEAEQEFLRNEIARLREEMPEIVFIAFPGDEKESGGCVAAGRGFFHINSHGGAEPCPFSPYSDTNIRDVTLLQAMNSPLFAAIRDGGLLLDDHIGGCVLHAKKAEVEALLG